MSLPGSVMPELIEPPQEFTEPGALECLLIPDHDLATALANGEGEGAHEVEEAGSRVAQMRVYKLLRVLKMIVVCQQNEFAGWAI